MSAAPRTARDFKFRFGILKFHRAALLDFAAKAPAQTPHAAEILSRIFKIPRRCFQTLRRLPLDTASLKFNQIGNRARCDGQTATMNKTLCHKAEHVEPKKVHGVDRKRAKF